MIPLFGQAYKKNDDGLEERNVKTAMIAEGIYQLPIPTPFAVGEVNLYLVAGETLTLVDVGPLTEEAWSALVGGMEQIGYRLEDVEQVVLTHHHVDHCGLLERVREVSGAVTLAHPLARPYVEHDKAFMEFHDQFFLQIYQESGVPEEKLSLIQRFHKMITTFSTPSKIDIALKHEQRVPGLAEWQVLYTPGHSQSHLSLYRERDRVFIGGDHIIKHISSNAFTEPPRDKTLTRPLTLVQYRTALEMCADMDIEKVLPGHGEVVTNHRELILGRLNRNWERTGVLRQHLRDGEKTAYQLTELLFPTLIHKEMPLTLSETLGHLDLLAVLHQVEIHKRNGVNYYSL